MLDRTLNRIAEQLTLQWPQLFFFFFFPPNALKTTSLRLAQQYREVPFSCFSRGVVEWKASRCRHLARLLVAGGRSRLDATGALSLNRCVFGLASYATKLTEGVIGAGCLCQPAVHWPSTCSPRSGIDATLQEI